MTCIDRSGMGRKKKDLDWNMFQILNLMPLARGIDGHHNHLGVCYHRWKPLLGLQRFSGNHRKSKESLL